MHPISSSHFLIKLLCSLYLYVILILFCFWNQLLLSKLFQSMIELSRTQDEEVGDGTTSVIVLGIPFLGIFIFLLFSTVVAMGVQKQGRPPFFLYNESFIF